MFIRVLIALRGATLGRRFGRLLDAPGVESRQLTPRADVWRELTHGDFDLLVVGRDPLGERPEDLVTAVRALPERPDIVVVADREDPGERARLLAAGCLAVLYHRLPDGPLRDTLHALIGRRREDAVQRLRGERPEERYSLADFISESPAMRTFLETPRRVAPSDSSILILGETGVGKERLARAMHAESPRSSGPFLAINCGALPEGLLESELFGHEEGAFTGATRSRKGYFELAHRGTLFLDEIGEMPMHLQVKLLRVLEDRTVRRVGGEKSARVDVRIMAASNRDLEFEIEAKRFRPDLYFRLAVVTLTVPPLRERREDIPGLVGDYVARFRIQTNRRVTSVAPEAVRALVAYGWPGNVRELINVIEQACLLCRSDAITLADLPRRITGLAQGAGMAGAAGIPSPADERLFVLPLPEARRRNADAFERRYLVELLRRSGGRVGHAARAAGIAERSLFERMRRLGIRKEDFRGGDESEAKPPENSRSGALTTDRPPSAKPRSGV